MDDLFANSAFVWFAVQPHLIHHASLLLNYFWFFGFLYAKIAIFKSLTLSFLPDWLWTSHFFFYYFMCSSSLWYMIHVILMLPSSSQYSFWKYTIWPLQTFLWTISFFFVSAISEWWKCKHIFKGKLLFLVGCQGFLSSIFVAFLASLLSFTQIVSSEMNITFISI